LSLHFHIYHRGEENGMKITHGQERRMNPSFSPAVRDDRRDERTFIRCLRACSGSLLPAGSLDRCSPLLTCRCRHFIRSVFLIRRIAVKSYV
jgi:hypothetical protein